MAAGKAWTLARAYQGVPKTSDFKLIDEKVPDNLKPGEILVEALYLSVDPYMRARPAPVGSVLHGEQVARVKVSNNPQYPAGCLVQFHHGWRTRAVISPDMKNDGTYGKLMLQKVPDLGGLSPSTALGVLGMPALTAYFAMEDKAKVQPGEVVMVSGAAGAVGSVVGQMSKIKGAKVIGSVGTDEKVALLKSWGFDEVFNYKKTTVDEALKKYAPDGLDLYFENVGGDFGFSVLQHMKKESRAIICGFMSEYNGQAADPKRNLYRVLIGKNMSFHGIMVWEYFHRFPEGVAQLLQWIKAGKLKYQEKVTDGFDKMPEAFISIFQGSSVGKIVVKV